MTPVSRLDAVVKQLAQKGFESGPAPSHVICLHEGEDFFFFRFWDKDDVLRMIDS